MGEGERDSTEAKQTEGTERKNTHSTIGKPFRERERAIKTRELRRKKVLRREKEREKWKQSTSRTRM